MFDRQRQNKRRHGLIGEASAADGGFGRGHLALPQLLAPRLRPYLFRTILLFLVGWGGLSAIVIYTLPTIWPRWSFFALWVVALTATTFPVLYFINTRFSAEKLETRILVRRALWVGVYGATLAWLQLARLVNVYVLLGLGFGLIAIESLVRLRERALWRAPEIPDAGDEHDQPPA